MLTRQGVIVGGYTVGLVILALCFARPTLAAPIVTFSDFPTTISSAPLPVWLSVSGLEPEKTYVYTLRVRQTGSSSDFGSFWNGSTFTTSYSPAGTAASDGSLSFAAVLKPGSVTSPEILRLRIKQTDGATPTPIDLPFAPSFGTVALTGHAYHLGTLMTEGYVAAVNEVGAVVSLIGLGTGTVSPWSTDPGAYALSLNSGVYTIQLLDSERSVVFESEVLDVGSDPITLDLDPPLPPAYSNEIFLSELFPDPAGDDAAGECIELWNRGSLDIDLGGWRLTDAGGGEHVFVGGTIAVAGSFLCVPYGISHLSLNNGGDTITLEDPSGAQHDQVTYGEATESESWAWDPAATGWRWSLEPTLGTANRFPPPPEAPRLAVDELRTSLPSEEVIIRGVVTASSGSLGSQIAYLQDETGGIQTYGSGDLPLGGLVELIGKIASYHNERRFKFTRSTMLGFGTLPSPERPDGSLNEALEGRLVSYTGRIVRIRGSTIWIDGGGGEIRVVFRSSLGWKRPNLRTGDLIRVQGIVGQYSDLDEPEEGYRLLPRLRSDFEILERYVKPKKPKTVKAPLVRTAEAAPVLVAADQERRLSSTTHPDRLLGFMLQLAGLLVLISGGLRALHRRDS